MSGDKHSELGDASRSSGQPGVPGWSLGVAVGKGSLDDVQTVFTVCDVSQ